MIDDSLLKTNFVGKDGFRWWVGQIAPKNVQGEQLAPKEDSNSWGNRLKVRIMGYHPFSKAELEDKDLPWANIMIPTTSGSGAANFATSVMLRPGDVVIGFFLDGETAQQPIIMGSFSRTGQVPQDLPSDSLGFLPFTGYTDEIPPPDGTLKKGESNEATINSQESPVTRKVADNEDKISVSTTYGISEVPADACEDNFVGRVSASLDDLLSGVGEATDFLSDVASVTKEIQNLATGAVSTMTESLYKSLIPTFQGGLEALYNDTYEKVLLATQSPALAALAGVDAQKAQVPKLAELENGVECLTGKVASGLGKTIRGMIEQALFEVDSKGRIQWFNEKFCELTEDNGNVTEGFDYVSIVEEDRREEFLKELHSCIEMCRKIDIETASVYDQKIHFTGYPYRVGDNSHEGFLIHLYKEN